MSELAFLIFKILFGIYLIIACAFFGPPYIAFLLTGRPLWECCRRTVSFVLTLLFLPLAAPFWIAYRIVRILVALIIVILFSWVALLFWLNARFPLGKLFKIWFNFSFR